MKKLTCLLSVCAFFAPLSFAQTPPPEAVGVVTRIEGLVTVSQNNVLGNGFKDEVILQNSRVVTTSSGSTTIRLNNGCIIDLKPNQALTIDFRRGCKAILADIQPVGAVGVAGAGGIGTAGVGTTVIVGAGVLAAAGVIRAISTSNENAALQRLSGS